MVVLTAPVLTRIFSPQDYDVLGIYLMASNLLGALATLQFNNVIIVSNQDSEAWDALRICFLTSLILALLLAIVLALFSLLDYAAVIPSRVFKWYYFLPLSFLFTGWGMALGSWANRKSHYRQLSRSRIIGALLSPCIAIGLGKIIAGPDGLFWGLLAGQLYPVLYLSYALLRTQRIGFDGLKTAFLSVFRRHKNFVKYSLVSELMNNLINQLPVFFLVGTQPHNGMIGNYNLCNRMLALPVNVISGSFGEVFRQQASADFHQQGNSNGVFLMTLKTLSMMALLPFLGVMIFGPDLFMVFFGSRWQMAGIFSSVMAPMFFFKFISSPLSYMYFIAGRQREDFLGHVVMLVSTLLIFALSRYLDWSVRLTFFLYGMVFSAIYVIYLMRSYKFSRGLSAA